MLPLVGRTFVRCSFNISSYSSDKISGSCQIKLGIINTPFESLKPTIAASANGSYVRSKSSNSGSFIYLLIAVAILYSRPPFVSLTRKIFIIIN